MCTDFFDYHLPPELIAQEPCAERDKSRLLVVRRSTQSIEHRIFDELPELLNPGDLLVLNDTRVVPARLVGRRARTGGRWEGLFLRELPDQTWEILSKSRGKLLAGEEIEIDPGPLRLCLLQKTQEGHWIVRVARPERREGRGETPMIATPFEDSGRATQPGRAQPEFAQLGRATQSGLQGSTLQLLEQYGQVPLPPYIRKGQGSVADRERYQTVYARQTGAVAAPTAGFHFTPRVLERLQERHIDRTFLTLHVGLGTFQPIQGLDVTKHVMHREWGEISRETADTIKRCKSRGGKVVAVGTTSARLLETVAARSADIRRGTDSQSVGTIHPWQGETDLYILPPYQFRAVDALITNFHLPRTTLLLLVSAFAGAELMKRAYEIAIEERYRFFSYGDAMLVL
ncbi:MAG TPA: tRNA preQ1(34) S-adenosylmethionine ribosyltransferase-isomerase QueA [Gemmataceae bacterium]|jgi:S-adenosylmethionine:tRNA ribosyltransferase-isomerase|nr:tRNA preQ1(34) S-adenosylmethionine ribosyltransferase-isomerase QueA [Gemmataceae bacterium]